jgi:triacylglycerol lipase
MRRSVGALALASLLFMLVGAPLTPTNAAGHDPILLVHGYRGSPSTWADMQRFLEKHGRTVYAIDLPSEDNVQNAAAIGAKLSSLGWSSADIIGQSMGGLSSRWFTKFLASDTTIDAYVSLGTAQYGIWSACPLPSSYGGQMCPTSQFLADLNAGDDTPGSTYWTTIYSTGDLYVPNSSSRLDGGACFVRVEGIGHNEMDNAAEVMKDSLAAVDHRCAGTFRD